MFETKTKKQRLASVGRDADNLDPHVPCCWGCRMGKSVCCSPKRSGTENHTMWHMHDTSTQPDAETGCDNDEPQGHYVSDTCKTAKDSYGPAPSHRDWCHRPHRRSGVWAAPKVNVVKLAPQRLTPKRRLSCLILGATFYAQSRATDTCGFQQVYPRHGHGTSHKRRWAPEHRRQEVNTNTRHSRSLLTRDLAWGHFLVPLVWTLLVKTPTAFAPDRPHVLEVTGRMCWR